MRRSISYGWSGAVPLRLRHGVDSGVGVRIDDVNIVKMQIFEQKMLFFRGKVFWNQLKLSPFSKLSKSHVNHVDSRWKTWIKSIPDSEVSKSII